MAQEEQPKNDTIEEIPVISFQSVLTPAKQEKPLLATVSLEQLAEWKQTGDYAQLEKHIRSGALEILPKETLYELVLKHQEHAVLIETLRSALEAFLPLAQNHEALSKYFDADSKLKVNIGKIMEEVISAQAINPFKKQEPKPLPFIALFQESIRLNKFQNIDLSRLEITLKNNQINFQPFVELLTRLGLLEKPKTNE